MDRKEQGDYYYLQKKKKSMRGISIFSLIATTGREFGGFALYQNNLQQLRKQYALKDCLILIIMAWSGYHRWVEICGVLFRCPVCYLTATSSSGSCQTIQFHDVWSNLVKKNCHISVEMSAVEPRTALRHKLLLSNRAFTNIWHIGVICHLHMRP